LPTTRWDDIGEVGIVGLWGSVNDDWKTDARGVGSTSSASSSADGDCLGSDGTVCTESLLWTFLSGEVSNGSREGVLKLKVLVGSNSGS
jgi:hypothetical protein